MSKYFMADCDVEEFCGSWGAFRSKIRNDCRRLLGAGGTLRKTFCPTPTAEHMAKRQNVKTRSTGDRIGIQPPLWTDRDVTTSECFSSYQGSYRTNVYYTLGRPFSRATKSVPHDRRRPSAFVRATLCRRRIRRANAAMANATYSLSALIGYFVRLGTWGFGGPVALVVTCTATLWRTAVGSASRTIARAWRWLSSTGPLAAQLAIYLGYVHYGVWGATWVGLAFVLPSFLMVLAISAAYVAYGGLVWMQAVFYGVGACVIGIIAWSVYD